MVSKRNVRGIYVNFTHDRAADWDFLAKWQPNVIRYMGQGSASDPNSFDVNRVKRIHDACPDATILLRCWEVDDNNFAAHDAMVADPRGTAEKQINWWAIVMDRAGAAGVPRDKLMAGLNNETGPEKDAALYPYSEAALEYGTQKAVRLGVFVFSAGRPSLPGEAEYTIDTFAKLDNAILANNGAVLLHEYMQPEGMYCVWTDEQGNERQDYTYLIGRHTRWPIQSPIIIAEWGIDGILYNRHPDPQYGNSGWRNFPQDWWPERYANEYVECVVKASPNVIGTCPFISDFADHKWQSFDLLEAYPALLARKDLCVQADKPTTPPIDPIDPTPPSGALVHPLPGAVITQHWGQNGDAYAQYGMWGHNGCDLGGVPAGTPIRCMADGVVVWSDWDDGYGWYIRIGHEQKDAYTFFGHMQERSPHVVGESVKAGATVGKVGNTGNSTGPHAHIEVRQMNPDGSYREGSPMPKGRVDPETWCFLYGLTL